MPTDSDTEVPPSVEKSLHNSLVRLETVSPGEPLTDFDAVDEVVADSTVIGLGEPSHGTREVFQFKHRLFRYLVAEHDCRLFAIEANYSSVRRLNECVTAGTGALKDELAASGIHGPWKCEAVLDLLTWIRSFNERHPDDQIRVHGFDMQNNKQTATDLLSYLDAVESSPPADIRTDLEELAAFDLGEREDEERRAAYAELCAHLASTLDEHFDDHESTYIDQSSERALARARHQLQLLEQASRQFSVTEDGVSQEGLQIRDQAMAENIAWLLDHESTSMAAVWAHNAHIKRGAIAGGLYGDVASMGQALAEHDGVDYTPLGFSIATGDVRSFSLETEQYESYPVGEPPDGSLPAVLAETGTEVGYLDLTQFSDSEVTDWFASEPPRYSITGGAIDGDPVRLAESNPQTDFDGIVFIRETNPARGLES